MTTTAAASRQAGVTVATIRHWCRYGAVAAIKQAGRWVIDTASLAHRIALGARRGRKATPVELSTESMVAIGGSRWQRGNMDRVYINDWAAFAGLDIERYNSGGIAAAAIDGRGIANGRAAALLTTIDKVWFDSATGGLAANHSGADAVAVRYLDGTRDTIDLLARTFAGIKAAVAAL